MPVDSEHRGFQLCNMSPAPPLLSLIEAHSRPLLSASPRVARSKQRNSCSLWAPGQLFQALIIQIALCSQGPGRVTKQQRGASASERTRRSHGTPGSPQAMSVGKASKHRKAKGDALMGLGFRVILYLKTHTKNKTKGFLLISRVSAPPH